MAQNAAASVPHGSSPTPEDLDDCALSLAVLRVLTTRLARATMQVRCDEDPALLEDYLEQIVADLRADAEALAALAQNAAASVPRGEARADTPLPRMALRRLRATRRSAESVPRRVSACAVD